MQKTSREEETITKEEKKLIKERAERDKVREENSKRESLKPYNEFLEAPLKTIEYLCSQGDFASYSKRMELFSMISLIQIQESLKELVNLLSKKN